MVSCMGQGERSAKADCRLIQFSGFLPLKILLLVSFIILMQSGFLYKGHYIGIGTRDFYSYNEIILIGNILMVRVDCTINWEISCCDIFSELLTPRSLFTQAICVLSHQLMAF